MTPSQEANTAPQPADNPVQTDTPPRRETGFQIHPSPRANGPASSNANGIALAGGNARRPSGANEAPQPRTATPLPPEANATLLRQEADAPRLGADTNEPMEATNARERVRKGKQRASTEEREGPEGSQKRARFCVPEDEDRVETPGRAPADFGEDAQTAVLETFEIGVGEATAGRREGSGGGSAVHLGGANLDGGVEGGDHATVNLGFPLTPARDPEQGIEGLSPARNNIRSMGESDPEGRGQEFSPRDLAQAVADLPPREAQVGLNISESPNESGEQPQPEPRRNLFGGAPSVLPPELTARGPLSPEPRAGVPPNRARDVTGDMSRRQLTEAQALLSHAEASGPDSRQGADPCRPVGSTGQETGSGQPGSSPGGASREQRGAEAAEGRATEEQAVVNSSPPEGAGELEACLSQLHVPQPTIAWLAQEGISMHNLEAGCLSRGEVLTMVREGLFPKDLFSLGTILLLEKATQQHRKA